MKKPLISVVIAAYNAEGFLNSAIESVLDQPLKELEIVVVNDGSKDNTESVCAEAAKRDSRVKYYTIENSGAGHARNCGVSHAEGDWVMFLDSDDLYLKDSLDQSLKVYLADAEQEGVQIVYTSKCTADMNLSHSFVYDRLENPLENGWMPTLAFWTGIYSRSLLVSQNIQFYEYRKQDIETAFRYLTYSKASKTALKPELCFYVQRLYPASNTHTWNMQNLHEIECKVYYDLYLNHATPSAQEYLKNMFLREMSAYYKDCFRNGVVDPQGYQDIEKIRKKTWKYTSVSPLFGKRHYYAQMVKRFLLKFKSRPVQKTGTGTSSSASPHQEPEDLKEKLAALSQFVRTL